MNLADPIFVLFIDDEAGQRELAKYWLGERWDFKVKTARTTVEGLAELKVSKFDAVVTDFHMTKLDGIEFLKKVRRDHPRLPFFFLSTKSGDNVIIEAMNLGADGFLLKTADVEPLYTDLASRIKAMVRRVREGEVLSEAIESLNRQSTTLSILNQVIIEASRTEELPQMLDHILSITIGMMDFDGGAIYLVDEKKRVARITHHRSIPDAMLQTVSEVRIDDAPYRRIFIEKSPLFIDHDRDVLRETSEQFGFSSMCSIPIMTRGRVIGALNLARRRPYSMNEMERSIAVSIGLEVGGILDRVIGREELSKILENMRVLFDSIDELIFIMEPDGKIVRANRSAVQKSGYTQEELEGMDVTMLVPEETREEIRKTLESMSSRLNLTLPGSIRRKDGTILDIESQISHGFWDGREVLISVSRDSTEANRYARVLEESERKYRLIAENSTDVIWKLDLATQRFTYISPSIMRLRGLTAEEAMEEKLEDSVTPEALAYIRESLTTNIQRLREGDMDSISAVGLFYQKHKDGHLVPVEIATTLLKGNDGNIREVLGVSRDATARIRSEQDLKDMTEELERFFRLDIDMLCIAALDGTFLKLNKSWETTLGFPLEELQGRKFFEFIHPDDQAKTLDAVKDLNERKDVINFVNRYRCRDGSYRWIEWRSTPHGGMIYAAARDITERMQFEDALRKSEEKLNLAIEGSEAGLWDWMVQTGELEVNERWAQMVGYTLEELSPLSIRTWEGLTHPDDLKMASQLLQSYFQGNIDRYECEIRMRHKNGNWIWIFDKGRISSMDMQGRPLRMNGTHLDITARKQTEEALIQVNNKLNLLNSITRHDIQNQIMILSGNISMARSGDQRVDVPTSLMKMEKAVMNIQKQIEFTKDYQNMGVRRPEWFNVSHIIKRGFETLSPADVRLHDSTSGFEMFADPLVEKVFYNLLDNSMRHGGEVKNITTGCEIRNGRLVITYMDDGVGISQEDRRRLFEKGFGKNTGLGLFISKEILSITSISIAERGEQGKGVRFEMEVPSGAWRPNSHRDVDLPR